MPKTDRPPAWLHASATRSEASGHPSRSWVNPLAGQEYRRDGNELTGAGLYVDLGPAGYHLFSVR